MAMYRLEAKVLTRSKGQSAIAAAAYRSGSAMTAPDGQFIDYTRKGGVAASFILAPADSPAWVQDRQALWAAVETGEKRKDAQLSREFTLNLPVELGLEAQEALVREWVTAELVAAGMAADVNLHMPREDHPHAHIMTTLRTLGPAGFSPKKNRDWNTESQLDQWRVSWELFQNQALAKAGLDARVDHRTYEAQGIERIGANLSRGAYELEKRGIPTREGEEVRAKVAAFNQQREQLHALEQELAALEAAAEQFNQEKPHAAATPAHSEPGTTDLTWCPGIAPSSVEVAGCASRGPEGPGLEPEKDMVQPTVDPSGPGHAGLGRDDASGASADPGSRELGGNMGTGAGEGLQDPEGELVRKPVLGPPVAARATGGPELDPVREPVGGPVSNPDPVRPPAPLDLKAHADQQQREFEASDPRDLRDLVAFRAEAIREVFPEVVLDVLEPVQKALELPGGHLHALRTIQATPEACQAEVFVIDDKIRDGFGKTKGITFERGDESLYVANTWFRAGYGIKEKLDPAVDVHRPWSESLGRLVRSSWNKLVEQAVSLADQARAVMGYRAESAARTEMQEATKFWDELPPSKAPEKFQAPAKDNDKGYTPPGSGEGIGF